MESFSSVKLYLVMTGMLITGTCNTLFLKYQDNTVALGNKFTHPYLQCGIMFVGMLSCTLVLVAKRIRRHFAKTPLLSDSTTPSHLLLVSNANPLLLAIPAFCDFTGCSLQYVALTMVDSSIY